MDVDFTNLNIPTVAEPVLAGLETTASQLRGTILLVEDESFVREVTCEILQSAGYLVLKAGNAREAIHAFRQCGEVQLLITDVVMPGQNGRDLAHQLRTICPGLRTLFISGYPENVVARHGFVERGTFYLPKPFSVQSLTQKVNQVLSGGSQSSFSVRRKRRA